jgi:uncharacterized protein (DUF697 family)
MALPISLGVVRGLLRELAVSARDEKPLVVGGARELAAVLRRELGRGARPDAIRADDGPEGAAVLVYVLAHDLGDDDRQALKRARRARVPVVAVAAGPAAAHTTIPFVLATDVVHVGTGEGFPIDAIVKVIAGRLGEEAAPLAARVPVLRGSVCRYLVGSFSRKNALTAAAVFVPGADLPILALHQARMLLRLEQAYGIEIDRDRLPEVLATVGAGLGLRALARELLDLVPVAGWAVKGAVAYAGTRALGEAAIRRLELGVDGTRGRD